MCASSSIRYSSDPRLRFQMEANSDPLMLCQTLNSAPGNAAVAEKNCSANATPNPEFCMPTSMAIV